MAIMSPFSSSMRTFTLLLAATFIVMTLPGILGSDLDVLIALRQTANVLLPSWNETVNPNFCLWEGVTCNNNSRVAALELFGGSPRAILFGSLPDSLPQLTELENLEIKGARIIGTLPQALFLSPIFRKLDVSETGLYVNFPPTIVAPLFDLYASDVVLNGWPNLDWSALEWFDFSSTNLSCPLPQSLVNFIKSGETFSSCRMQNVPLDVDSQNMICGQIPLGDFPCDFLQSYRTPFFPTDVRPAVDYRVERGPLTVEFVKDEFYLFASYLNRRTGVRAEYRREYLSFKILPFSQFFANNVSRNQVYVFNQSRFDTFVWETDQRLRVNMTAVNNIVLEIGFDFNRTLPESGLSAIKFSLVIYNLGYVWRERSSFIEDHVVNINLIANSRHMHSKPAGPPIVCPATRNFISVCSSEVSNISITIEGILTSDPQHAYSFNSLKTRTSLGFALTGTIDGRPLSGFNRNFGVVGQRSPWPLPSAAFMENYSELNASFSFPPMPEQEQAFLLPIQLQVPKIVSRLFYDPDISITLLFDPSESADLPPEKGAETQNYLVVTIVVVVVGLIVIALGILVFAKVVFPYLQARKDAKKAPLKDVEASSKQETSSKWTPSSRPSSKI